MGYFYGIIISGLDLREFLKVLPVVPLEPWNYHITILYLGNKRPGDDVSIKVRSALARVPCFHVVINEFVLLPSEAKPRVLALSIKDNGNALVRLRNALLNIINDTGLDLKDRFIDDFKPHMTIGYIRSKVNPWYLREILSEIEIPRTNKALLINKVSLIHAHENSYKALEDYDLTCN